MNKIKKSPLRKCVGCGEMKTKKELVRVIKTSENEILIDNTSARVKWQLMLKLAWSVTIVAAGTNLFLLEIIRG